MLELLIEQWQQQSILEVIAVVFAVAYVWLASQASIWCWPAGFISTSLYTFVFIDVTLVFQMLLNIYYMLMAIYGFITWRKQDESAILISKMPLKEHVYVILVGSLGSLVVYFVALTWLEYELIFLDIALTIFSLIATLLTVRKRFECWYYWSLINLATIFLYIENQLYLSVVLMIIYIVLAIRGVIIWHANWFEQSLPESDLQK